MTSFHDDLSGFGSINSSGGLSAITPIQEVISAGSGLAAAIGQSGGGAAPISGHAPDPTLIIGLASNLAIDLIWDGSVQHAPKGFMGAVDAAAELLVSILHTTAPTVLYIDIGWGEYNGGPLDPGALGENWSNVWTPTAPDYQAVVDALAAHGDNVTTAAADAPGLASVAVGFTTAEGKALGLLPENYTGPSSPNGIDGAVGFATSATLAATGNSWQFGAVGTGPTQYNLVGVALHELTEVMGRLSSEGYGAVPGGLTPLDLLTFNAPGSLALYPGGYFSTNDGVTPMGQFNAPILYQGNYYLIGDVGDWASFYSVSDSQTLPPNLQDTFDAVLRPGYNLTLSLDDLLVMKAIGY
jgi:hypothetical protein